VSLVPQNAAPALDTTDTIEEEAKIVRLRQCLSFPAQCRYVLFDNPESSHAIGGGRCIYIVDTKLNSFE
jgi:hypothetical protein